MGEKAANTVPNRHAVITKVVTKTSTSKGITGKEKRAIVTDECTTNTNAMANNETNINNSNQTKGMSRTTLEARTAITNTTKKVETTKIKMNSTTSKATE